MSTRATPATRRQKQQKLTHEQTAHEVIRGVPECHLGIAERQWPRLVLASSRSRVDTTWTNTDIMNTFTQCPQVLTGTVSPCSCMERDSA